MFLECAGFMNPPGRQLQRGTMSIELVHLPEAARELGVSYPTLKQWIYRGKIHTVKTPGGHHRIPRMEIDRLLFRMPPHELPRSSRKTSHSAPAPRTRHEEISGLEQVISGRNQLVGRITQIKKSGLLAKVTLDIGGQSVTAIITRDSCEMLKLKLGDTAAALIKATEVMIIRANPLNNP